MAVRPIILPQIELDDSEAFDQFLRGQRHIQRHAESLLKLNNEYTNAHLDN